MLTLNSLFNHSNLMKKSLDVVWQRQNVISHNIANVDTPGYKSKSIDFEARFRAALLGQGGDGFVNYVTHEKHFAFGEERVDPMKVQPIIVQNDHYTMRMDGNNVDIDHEMNEAAKNTIYYYTMLNKVSSELGRLRTVVRDIR